MVIICWAVYMNLFRTSQAPVLKVDLIFVCRNGFSWIAGYPSRRPQEVPWRCYCYGDISWSKNLEVVRQIPLSFYYCWHLCQNCYPCIVCCCNFVLFELRSWATKLDFLGVLRIVCSQHKHSGLLILLSLDKQLKIVLDIGEGSVGVYFTESRTSVVGTALLKKKKKQDHFIYFLYRFCIEGTFIHSISFFLFFFVSLLISTF